ncbi:MAG: NAD(P)-dependent alcohol dehydrogenase [Bacteroidales bacterium]|nr:NAD(P)-dependent alcohol dehydrogenase [Bacteroidales bacterium]
MRAAIINKYGKPDVLSIEDIDIPQPLKDQILIKVNVAGLNPLDYKMRDGSLKFMTTKRFPKILGGEVAGEVVDNSQTKGEFAIGDRVFAMLDYKGGAYGEYVAVNENWVAHIPEHIDFVNAAAVPLAGLTAFQALTEKGNIRKGMKILINGASGGVGHYAVQIAKAYECKVTAFCSASNIEMVKNLGADKVIDYNQTAVSDYKEKFHVIFDTVGIIPYRKINKMLETYGCFISTYPSPGLVFRQSLNGFLFKRAWIIMTHPSGSDLEVLGNMMKQNQLIPHIEKVYPLNEIQEAHKHLETHRVKGKLVVLIDD